MGPAKSDNNKGLITLSMITLSGFHCSTYKKGIENKKTGDIGKIE
jgi:hypothetical protein